jgi:SAM-dependent methyltransferase/uncharacterized protein YbaR (Trm112 family)
MDSWLLELLVCPSCRADLTLESFDAPDGREGLLRCTSGAHRFPVIRGIPRMLSGPMRAQLLADNPEFFERHGARFSPEDGFVRGAAVSDANVRTARSFGYEWSAFSEMLAAYEQNYRWYMGPLDESFLRGKLVLDAGCGTGRHTFYTSRSGARVVGVDLSRAIDVAARNNAPNPTAHFVQADLCALPFRDATFDFVYSFGVLHHLPDPEGAFRGLLRYLRPGGHIRVYLYWSLESETALKRAALRVVTASREVTTRLPYRVLNALTLGIAAAFQVAFVIPTRVLRRFESTRGLANRVPLRQYADYPFRVLHTDQFDRFSAPIENRYSRAEVRAWFDRAGLTDVSIEEGLGWRAMGQHRP